MPVAHACVASQWMRMPPAMLAQYKQGKSRLHYVTAREMFNCARAAMDGMAGDPSQYFDYLIKPPPIASAS